MDGNPEHDEFGDASEETLLERVLPAYEFRGVRSRRVRATPEQIFRALDTLTLDEMPLAGLLGALRYLPGRALGKTRRPLWDRRPFFALLEETGNIVLAEDLGRERVIGAIGKLHQALDQEPVTPLDRERFRAFDDPSYQKLAQSLRVSPARDGDGQIVTFEHRTHALGPESCRRFARYWRIIGRGSDIVVGLLLSAIARRAEAEAKRERRAEL